jgi:hypothetical protein
MSEEDRRIKRLLQELDGDEEGARKLAALLAASRVPRSRPHRREMLLARLEQDLHTPRRKSLLDWYPLALLRAQMRVIHSEIPLASAFALILGLVATLTGGFSPMSFAVVAPIVAALGMALLYDDDIRQMLELESATRASTWQILLARMTLVYGFDLLVALLASVVLALVHQEVLLLDLIAAWFAPMAFLSGLAFFLSVLFLEPLLAASASLVLWVIHRILIEQRAGHPLAMIFSLPGLADPVNRPFLIFAGLVLALVALWLATVRETPLRGVR